MNRNAQIGCLLWLAASSPAVAAEMVPIAPIYVGPPYTAHDEPWTGNHVANSVSQAISNLWLAYRQYWGVQPYGPLVCAIHTSYKSDGLVTGKFATFGFSGDCNGGNQVTAPPRCPSGYQNSETGVCEGDSDAIVPEKTFAETSQCPIGNPISIGTGNKYQVEQDYRSTNPDILQFTRYYNSADTENIAAGVSGFGNNWRYSYSARILLKQGSALSTAILIREDGKRHFYSLIGGAWVSDSDVHGTLVRLTDAGGAPVSWKYLPASDVTESYRADGRLTEIRDSRGIVETVTYDGTNRLWRVESNLGGTLAFEYDEANRIRLMTDSAGRSWAYEYDSAGNLERVHYPDGTPDPSDNPARRYHYEDPAFPHALTGVTDERHVRYATFEYQADGRAIASYHAGNVERMNVTYDDAAGVHTVTNSREEETAYQTIVKLGVPLRAQVNGPGCSTCGGP